MKKALIILLALAAAWYLYSRYERGDLSVDSVLAEVGLSNQEIVRGTINTSAKSNEHLAYAAFIPDHGENDKLPVLIAVGGLNSNGEQFMRPPFTSFAQKHRVAIVGVHFKNNMDDWNNRSSYHYPGAWSGSAMDRILQELAKAFPLDTDHLFTFGFSAGAQFAHRYALLNSHRVKAVAAHAAGGYTNPYAKIDTRFLITVGQTDTDRLKRARDFVDSAKRFGIQIDLKVIPGQGHSLSRVQIEQSLQLFASQL